MIGLIILVIILCINVGIALAKDGEIHERYSAGKTIVSAIIDGILLYMIYNHI